MNFAQNELGPDRELSNSEKELIHRLSGEDLAKIDSAILDFVDLRWRKFAYIVGSAIGKLGDAFADLPDVYFASRLRQLAENEGYEIQGYVENMRYASIRKVQSVDKEN